MNENEKKNKIDYHMRGLALFGRILFTAFLVWCTFHYPMSDNMRSGILAWAFITWLFS